MQLHGFLSAEAEQHCLDPCCCMRSSRVCLTTRAGHEAPGREDTEASISLCGWWWWWWVGGEGGVGGVLTSRALTLLSRSLSGSRQPSSSWGWPASSAAATTPGPSAAGTVSASRRWRTEAQAAHWAARLAARGGGDCRGACSSAASVLGAFPPISSAALLGAAVSPPSGGGAAAAAAAVAAARRCTMDFTGDPNLAAEPEPHCRGTDPAARQQCQRNVHRAVTVAAASKWPRLRLHENVACLEDGRGLARALQPAILIPNRATCRQAQRRRPLQTESLRLWPSEREAPVPARGSSSQQLKVKSTSAVLDLGVCGGHSGTAGNAGVHVGIAMAQTRKGRVACSPVIGAQQQHVGGEGGHELHVLQRRARRPRHVRQQRSYRPPCRLQPAPTSAVTTGFRPCCIGVDATATLPFSWTPRSFGHLSHQLLTVLIPLASIRNSSLTPYSTPYSSPLCPQRSPLCPRKQQPGSQVGHLAQGRGRLFFGRNDKHIILR